MKTGKAYSVVLVTAPDRRTARELARKALEARLAACVSLVPQVESHYWWQDKIEKSREVLLVLKTTRKHVRDLEAQILAGHPYETPEFLALPVSGGSAGYLGWLDASLR